MVLNHSVIGSDSADRYLLVLHGIYGSGGNWRTFARKLIERRPDWAAVLVDLRMHGKSQGFEPPHTVAAAAADLAALADQLDRPVRAVAGHSFGGKVTLTYARDHGADLDQAWIFDASPAPRPDGMQGDVAAVLRMLEQLPSAFEDRDAFVDHITDQGFPTMVGNWLAMNLEQDGDRYRFRLDPAALRAMLEDYFAIDLWPVVDAPPCPLRFIIAGKAATVTPDDRARLEAAGDRVGVDVIPDAGHWLHIDALPALLDLVAAGLAK
jgi:pimeloyl-ACP methyl ester carboxylesterase